jgi:tRNA 2-thiocytidine biosynthesis protein TtcA
VASVDPLGYTVLKMKRVENKLLSRLTRASTEHHLLEDGDRIMVAMSGGKDSYVMLHLLRLISRASAQKLVGRARL